MPAARDLVRRLVRRMRSSGPSQWDRLAAEGIVSAGPGSYELSTLHVHEYRTPSGEWIGGRVRIGAYCSLGPTQFFVSGNHSVDWVSTYPFRSLRGLPGTEGENRTRGDIVIGNDVWVGFDSMIMSGVTIGSGAVIGARSLVSKDVAPYTIVAGNPARVVGQRFDDETIAWLLELAWWDWPADKITASLDFLGAPPPPPGDR